MTERRVPSPKEIERRLRFASALSDLSPEKRLDSKIDLTPEGIRARIEEVANLVELCERLAASRR